MNPKELGTVAVNVVVIIGAFVLAGFRVITFPAALAGIGCLVLPSAAPVLFPKLLDAMTPPPPRGPSTIEATEKERRS